MNKTKQAKRHFKFLLQLDFVLLAAVAAIILIGLVVLRSAAASEVENYLMKQCMWLGVGLVVLLISFRFDYSVFAKYYRQIYIAVLVLLVAVLVFGSETKGAKSWFVIPGVGSLQPAELAKIMMIQCGINY